MAVRSIQAGLFWAGVLQMTATHPPAHVLGLDARVELRRIFSAIVFSLVAAAIATKQHHDEM